MNVSLDNSPTYACRVCAKQVCGCKDENSPAPCHFYTAPPQREWQGLTDDEIKAIAATPAAIPGSYVHSVARAIEAKLKEKNT